MGLKKIFVFEIFFGPVIVDFGGILLVVLILLVTWVIVIQVYLAGQLW